MKPGTVLWHKPTGDMAVVELDAEGRTVMRRIRQDGKLAQRTVRIADGWIETKRRYRHV